MNPFTHPLDLFLWVESDFLCGAGADNTQVKNQFDRITVGLSALGEKARLVNNLQAQIETIQGKIDQLSAVSVAINSFLSPCNKKRPATLELTPMHDEQTETGNYKGVAKQREKVAGKIDTLESDLKDRIKELQVYFRPMQCGVLFVPQRFRTCSHFGVNYILKYFRVCRNCSSRRLLHAWRRSATTTLRSKA